MTIIIVGKRNGSFLPTQKIINHPYQFQNAMTFSRERKMKLKTVRIKGAPSDAKKGGRNKKNQEIERDGDLKVKTMQDIPHDIKITNLIEISLKTEGGSQMVEN